MARTDGTKAKVNEGSNAQDLVANGNDKGFTHIYALLSLQELVDLAKKYNIKRQGINWGKQGTPQKNKKSIIDALMPIVDESDRASSNSDSYLDEVADTTTFDLAAKMYDDFSLQDLVDLARRYGIKREGVYWGKDGTPKKNKKAIIAALIEKHKAEGKEQTNFLDGVPEQELKQMQDAGWENYYVEEEEAPIDYMHRSTYRRHLLEANLLQTDQDVFHIIASANGGPDHPDNYLGALGAGFNRSIGARRDYFCCFIAGLEKTRKAVQRALEAEILYHKHPSFCPKLFSKSPPALYSENSYNREAGRCLTAEELVDRGKQEWAKMRLCEID